MLVGISLSLSFSGRRRTPKEDLAPHTQDRAGVWRGEEPACKYLDPSSTCLGDFWGRRYLSRSLGATQGNVYLDEPAALCRRSTVALLPYATHNPLALACRRLE